MGGVVVTLGVVTRMSPPLWQPRPDVWLLVVLLYGGYRYLLASRHPGDRLGRRGVTRGQHGCFLAGVAVLWAATDGPLDTIGETYLFSVHMVQFLLLTLVAPPLLLLGSPSWLLRDLLTSPRVEWLVRTATRPRHAMLLFNAVIMFSHWPAVVEVYLRNDVAHFAMHGLWVASALAWWWPVLSPLPEIPHLSSPQRMAYLFAQSILPTIPASFLTFGSAPLFAFYADAAPRLGVSPITDQQIAGLLMKIGGGLWVWAIIAALFFRWSHESTTGAPDWIRQRDRSTMAPSAASEEPDPFQW